MLTSKVKVCLTRERYHGQGWGLFQVLQGMTGSAVWCRAAQQSARSARATLTKRVQIPTRTESNPAGPWLVAAREQLHQELNHREPQIPSAFSFAVALMCLRRHWRRSVAPGSASLPAAPARAAAPRAFAAPALPATLHRCRRCGSWLRIGSDKPRSPSYKSIYESLSPNDSHVSGFARNNGPTCSLATRLRSTRRFRPANAPA